MSATIPAKTGSLKVPGADLYYEVRGSGPVLLMMPGGPADAGVFGKIAGHLASNYTVVTYDPRGLSHSKLEGPLDEERMVEVFADDVHRLLAATAKEKALVYASSGGATIALELVARHPDQLSTVVVHEPPSPGLLPDGARVRADMEDVVEIYRNAGMMPALQKFVVLTRVREVPPPPPQGEMTPEAVEAMAQMQRNMDLFFGPYMLAIARYEPDIDALKVASCRIVPGIGNESRGELAHDCGLGLAQRLGTEAVVFPGAHTGFDSHPSEFATKLRQVLEG